MAQEIGLSIENLAALDAEKLVQLILDEAEGNVDFRKRVIVALANAKCPDSVAALVDRRLCVLERAQVKISREKEREFAADLDAIMQTIVKDLAGLNPALALQRLLRFISTHANVCYRIDDEFDSLIPDIYFLAVEVVPDLINKLSSRDLANVPKWLTSGLNHDVYGHTVRAALAAVPLLPKLVLVDWDRTLERLQNNNPSALTIRQAIANARGDIDRYLALEMLRPIGWQDPLRVAEKLLVANRLEEALAWARREMFGHAAFNYDLRRTDLEALILEALKKRPAEGISNSAMNC